MSIVSLFSLVIFESLFTLLLKVRYVNKKEQRMNNFLTFLVSSLSFNLMSLFNISNKGRNISPNYSAKPNRNSSASLFHRIVHVDAYNFLCSNNTFSVAMHISDQSAYSRSIYTGDTAVESATVEPYIRVKVRM